MEGVFTNVEEAVAACVRVHETVAPNADWVPEYEEGYARFRALYPAVRGITRSGSGFETSAARGDR